MHPFIAAAVLATTTLITAGTAGAETPQAAPPTPAHKSPTLAFSLSFGGTLVSIAALPFGVLLPDPSERLASLGVAALAPSAGTLYAGHPLTPGLALRSVGVAVVVAALERDDVCGPEDHGCPHLSGTTRYLLEAGAAAVVVGGVWDCIRAVRGVKAHNARVDLTLTPVVTPTSSGLALTGRF